MSITRGAGGLSLGVNLAISTVVPMDAPAFELLGNLDSNTSLTEARVADLLQQLGGLFRSGKASPRDIDKHGCSLFMVSLIGVGTLLCG